MAGETNMLERPRWRLRVSLMLAVLVVAVLLTRLIWGWSLERRLRAQLEEIRRRGEPVEVADVVYPPLPDSQNAWVLQTQADNALAVENPVNQTNFFGVACPRDSNLDFEDYPPFPSQWMALAEKSEKANAPAFALARQARQLTFARFRQRPAPYRFSGAGTYLNGERELAATLADAALYVHLKGDDAEAVERVRDVLHLARSLHQDDFPFSQFVALGSETMACNAAQIIGSGLRPTTASTRPATTQSVRQLIAELLDDAPAANGLRRSILLERLASIEECRTSLSGAWLIRPLPAREFVANKPNVDLLLAAVACNNWPQAKALLEKCRWEPDAGSVPIAKTVPVFRNSHWDQFADPSDYQVERYFRILCERRATALALACQLYRIDHAHWPQRLEELLPAYLPALPINPFFTESRPLGYIVLKGKLPGGGDRPLIYFDPDPPAQLAAEPMYGEMTYGWLNDDRNGRFYVGAQFPIPAGAGVRFVRVPAYRDLARFAPPSDAK